MFQTPKTLSVPSSFADGQVNWDNRNNGNGVNFTTARADPVGYHQLTSLQWCRAYVFKFGDGTPGSGLPKQRQITSAKLQLHGNNVNSTGLEYLWIGVENNLNPTKQGIAMTPANPDRFHDSASASALAGNPLQRLCAQTAATTYFDGRSGVTHSGVDAAARAVPLGPRHPSALIYQAFRQPTISVWNGPLNGGWNDTNDFAPALQPLLDDPDWNPDLQYVMVFFFVANRDENTDALLFGLGELGTINYNNGQNGTDTDPGGTNAGGQVDMYDFTDVNTPVGTFAPRLILSHQHPGQYEPLDLAGGTSKLQGQAYLTGRKPIVEWRGRRWDPTSDLPHRITPRANAGAGDTPLWDMRAANPNSFNPLLGEPLDTKVKQVNYEAAPSGFALWEEGYASATCTAYFNPAIWPYEQMNFNMQAYSMRFYFQMDGEQFPSSYWEPIAFHKALDTSWPDASTYVWDVRLRGGYTTAFPTVNHHGEQQIGAYLLGVPENLETASVNATSLNREVLIPYNPLYPMRPHPGMYRFEIQVDQNRNPKVRVRIYTNANDTTPFRSLTANPTNDVSAGYVRLGKTTDMALPRHAYYADLELHPNYDLSGQFRDPVPSDETGIGAPYVRQKWEWFEWDGTKAVPLIDIGTVAAIDEDGTSVVMTTPPNPLTFEDDHRDIYNVVDAGTDKLGYVVQTNIPYVPGFAGVCTLDRYRPKNPTTGLAVTGNLPCVIYVHGGFWTSGDKNQVMIPLVNLFTSMGWEVASINYTLGAPNPLNPSNPYPPFAIGDNGTGRFPSYVVQTKLAALFMGNQTNVDASRIILFGFSAGGYLVGAAAYSRNMLSRTVSGATGINLTVSNTDYGGTEGLTDPEIMGVIMLDAPVDLNTAVAWDPTWPKWPVTLLAGNGLIRATAKTFMGRPLADANVDCTGTGLTEFITDQTLSNIPPSYYQQGGSDYLVHWEHADMLVAALRAKSVAAGDPPDKLIRHRLQPMSIHDNAQREYDPDDIVDWMEGNGFI